VTVEATHKGSKGTAGSMSPTLHYLFPCQYVKGVCQELQTHNDWQLGTTTGQAAIPLG